MSNYATTTTYPTTTTVLGRAMAGAVPVVRGEHEVVLRRDEPRELLPPEELPDRANRGGDLDRGDLGGGPALRVLF